MITYNYVNGYGRWNTGVYTNNEYFGKIIQVLDEPEFYLEIFKYSHINISRKLKSYKKYYSSIEEVKLHLEEVVRYLELLVFL